MTKPTTHREIAATLSPEGVRILNALLYSGEAPDRPPEVHPRRWRVLVGMVQRRLAEAQETP